MEKLYQTFKDTVEFRIVYIREAHAADGRKPSRFAEEKGITEHDDYGERCSIADMMMEEENITIPCIIDNMDNQTNQDYAAWPDRIFIVRKDGRIAIAAARGPKGFNPALKETKKWLHEYRETGKEPKLEVN